jgi:membrane protease YdiL (CAAX protease family)
VTRRWLAPDFVARDPEVLGISILVMHNLVVHRWLRPPVDAALNLMSASILWSLARRAGCTPRELGVDRADLKAGVKMGAVTAACCSAGICIAAAYPATRGFFLDTRLTGISRKEALIQAALRIPLATALAEEIMFRSALHALMARKHSLPSALAYSSTLFGLWHVLPTLDTFEGITASHIVGGRKRGRLSAVVSVIGLTAGGGLFFSYLRLRSRSVAASVLAHASLNVASFLLGRSLVSRQLSANTYG